MLRDVTTTITDGGLGVTTPKGEGVHLKIGVSSIQSKNPIIINGNMSHEKIKEKLGLSPLADACMDSVENGSNLIYCIPVAATVDGTIGEIKKTVTGTGSVAVQGKPNNAYDIVVKFTGTGGLNQALLKYSIDGGNTWDEELTLSLDGNVEIPQTGITFKFTEGVTQAKSFEINDTYEVKTTAPQMNNQDVISAIEKIKSLNLEFEFVHIVGESAKALWVAVSQEQKRLYEIYHKPMFFILEAYNIQANQSIDDYVMQLLEDKKSIENYDIQVVTARSIYTRMDGTTKEINNTGIICGLYSRAKVQQSIGETKVFSVSEGKLLKLMPEGIDEVISMLDGASYVTFRKYDGLSGFYVTNARMMCPENSDYRYAELVRVKNKIVKETRKEALSHIQSEVDMSDLQGSLETIAKFIEIPLDKMSEKKEISSARIIVPENQDILATEKLSVKIRYVPIGHIREIEIDLGMENPYKK